jgi:hypothetical protein
MAARAPITVRSAEISTATVEIKTVTVNRKQMTLAMFRQLRDEPLVSEDGKLNGNPWGSVNCHPGECWAVHQDSPGPGWAYSCKNDHGSHLYVIWQRGDELLKSLVHERDWCRSWQCLPRDYFGISSELVQSYFCASGHRELPSWAQIVETRPYERSVVFSCEGEVLGEGARGTLWQRRAPTVGAVGTQP